MRLPYLRAAAPDVLAVARAQRWDPAEVLRVLLEEEIVSATSTAPKEADVLTPKVANNWPPPSNNTSTAALTLRLPASAL